MSKVLARIAEAANRYKPTANHINLSGQGGDLTVTLNETSRLLGFITDFEVKDDLAKRTNGVSGHAIKVITIKYTGSVGNPSSDIFPTTTSVYKLIKCFHKGLIDKEIPIAIADELLDFADFVVQTNSKTRTDYRLSEEDITEHALRQSTQPSLKYVDNPAGTLDIQVLLPLLNHLNTTNGFRWLYRHLSETYFESLGKVDHMTFIDYLTMGLRMCDYELAGVRGKVHGINNTIEINYLENKTIRHFDIRHQSDRITIVVYHNQHISPGILTTRTSASTSDWSQVYLEVLQLLKLLPSDVYQEMIKTIDQLLRLAGLSHPIK